MIDAAQIIEELKSDLARELEAIKAETGEKLIWRQGFMTGLHMAIITLEVAKKKALGLPLILDDEDLPPVL